MNRRFGEKVNIFTRSINPEVPTLTPSSTLPSCPRSGVPSSGQRLGMTIISRSHCTLPPADDSGAENIMAEPTVEISQSRHWTLPSSLDRIAIRNGDGQVLHSNTVYYKSCQGRRLQGRQILQILQPYLTLSPSSKDYLARTAVINA